MMTTEELITLNVLLERYRGNFYANSEIDNACFKVEKQLTKDITNKFSEE